DDDLSAGDRRAVDQEVGGLAGAALQRDDGADAQLERLADRHVRPADLDAQLHRDLAEAAEVGGARGGAVLAAGLELLVLDRLRHRPSYCTVRSGIRTDSSL